MKLTGVRLVLLALVSGLLVAGFGARTSPATAAPVVPCVRTFNGAGGAIAPGTATAPKLTPFSISVPAWSTVQDIDVTIRASHPNAANLRLDLLKTATVRSVAMARIASNGAQVSPLTFDDHATLPYGKDSPAGTYRPAEVLSEHNGQPAGGTWYLYAYNWDATAGSLTSWSVTITYSACDEDGDGAEDRAVDNCVGLANPDQLDLDGDRIGNACDDDLDGDGVANNGDNCLTLANPDQANADGDASGDACDGDRDGDGIAGSDNCQTVPNADQVDSDRDGAGNACDADDDADGRADAQDRCPLVGAASASGCPPVDLSVKLKLKKRTLLVGRLTSDAAPCTSRQKVTVFAVRRGKDKRIERVRSSASGRFKTKLGRRTGAFYAKVSSAVVDGVADCSAAKSRKVTVRRR